MRPKCYLLFIGFCLATFFAAPTFALVPNIVPLQGMITDDGGAPLDGAYTLTFRLYESPDEITPTWVESHTDVSINKGFFTVYIGDIEGLPLEIFVGDNDLWLSMAVGNDEMSREQLGAVPFALQAQICEQVGSLAEGDIQPILAGDAACPEGFYLRGWDAEKREPICEENVNPSSLLRADDICVSSSGKAGFVRDGVCVLSYDNRLLTDWNSAAVACIAEGGDLCSAAQYYSIRTNDPDLFYASRAVWTNDFSDNDANVKGFASFSSDDPVASQLYGYGCCGLMTPEPFYSQGEIVNGVRVTYVHAKEDTSWRAAARVCHSRGSDLCSKSEYVALNDAKIFGATERRATPEMSDNDASLFSSVVGTNAADNGSWGQLFAYACCGSNLPRDGICPGERHLGLCVASIHDKEDATFFEAARACTAMGADICSKSQMQVLRNASQFFGMSWTRDGADNDSTRVGGLLNSQPDNPNPSSDHFGYACCY